MSGCSVFPDEVHISKNVRRLLRVKQFDVTFDQDFAGVIAACAEPRQGHLHLTWITPDVVDAYTALHEAG